MRGVWDQRMNATRAAREMRETEGTKRAEAPDLTEVDALGIPPLASPPDEVAVPLVTVAGVVKVIPVKVVGRELDVVLMLLVDVELAETDEPPLEVMLNMDDWARMAALNEDDDMRLTWKP